jgi:hypothetical protein
MSFSMKFPNYNNFSFVDTKIKESQEKSDERVCNSDDKKKSILNITEVKIEEEVTNPVFPLHLQEKGDVGSQGDKGDVGSQGDKGDVGSQGDKGDVGSQGDKGDVGSQGEKGDVGSQGDKGDVGSQGEKGDVGSQGEKGDVGSQGDKVLLHNCDITVDTSYKTLLTLPFFGGMCNLKTALFAVNGKGTVNFELKNMETNDIIGVIKTTLDSNKIISICIDQFNKIPNKLCVISLHGFLDENEIGDSVKLLAVEFIL